MFGNSALFNECQHTDGLQPRTSSLPVKVNIMFFSHCIHIRDVVSVMRKCVCNPLWRLQDCFTNGACLTAPEQYSSSFTDSGLLSLWLKSSLCKPLQRWGEREKGYPVLEMSLFFLNKKGATRPTAGVPLTSVCEDPLNLPGGEVGWQTPPPPRWSPPTPDAILLNADPEPALSVCLSVQQSVSVCPSVCLSLTLAVNLHQVP